MTDEEEEYVDQAMAKPVFVRSSDRITVKEREKLAEEEKVPLTPPVHRRQPPEGTYLAYTRGSFGWRGGGVLGTIPVIAQNLSLHRFDAS